MKVAGSSMLPTLQPGDRLAVRPPRPGEPRPGQIVVVVTPEREVVKRVGARASDPGTVWLEGDNPAASTDSRATGPVPRERIVGVARARYWPHPKRFRP